MILFRPPELRLSNASESNEGGNLASDVTSVNASHHSKAQASIVLTDFGKVMDCKLVQSLNAPGPMLLTDFPIETESNFIHCANPPFDNPSEIV